jgi:subtilisin
MLPFRISLFTKVPIVLHIAVLITFLSCTSPEEVVKPKVEDCLTNSSMNDNKIIEGEYIIAVNGSAGGRAMDINRILKNHGIDGVTSGTENKSIFTARLSNEEAKKLSSDAAIKHIEPDRVISACGCFSVVDTKTVTWNVNHVGYGSGEGKTAWVIDSGIDASHPDLNVNKSLSKSFMESESSLEDENGHGTHVAGIIGAINNDIGTLGVAAGATLVSLKVLGSNGEGKLSNMLYALQYIDQQFF